MISKTKYILSVIILLAAVSSYAVPITVKAKLDSVVIMMGKQTSLHYQIVQDKNIKGEFVISDSTYLAPNVEMIGLPISDTTDLGNNRIQIDRSLIIQSFDSGVWEIPAAKYAVGKDTILSNVLNLKVIPINVDSLKTINDYKDVEETEFKFSDYLPDFLYYYWWIIVLLIIVLIVSIWIYQRKKKGISIIPVKAVQIPPYEEALKSLSQLKSAQLWQAGKDKEYFTQLTDILRRYIDRRFKINAIEMTSAQIIDTLKLNEETKIVKEQLEQILDVADYVKFANVRPLPDDSEGSWNKAVAFVENTKPAVSHDTESDNKKTNKKDN